MVGLSFALMSPILKGMAKKARAKEICQYLSRRGEQSARSPRRRIQVNP